MAVRAFPELTSRRHVQGPVLIFLLLVTWSCDSSVVEPEPDVQAPELHLISPDSLPSLMADSILDVVVLATDNRGVVRVTLERVEPTGSGSSGEAIDLLADSGRSVTVRLRRNLNEDAGWTLRLRAYDAADQSGALTLTLPGLDTLGPELTVDDPANSGFWHSGPLRIRGRVRDAAGLYSLRLGPVTLFPDPGDTAIVFDTVYVPHWGQQRLEAVDWLGNVTEIQFDVWVDNDAPQVDAIAPAFATGDSVRLFVEATDRTGPLMGARVGPDGSGPLYPGVMTDLPYTYRAAITAPVGFDDTVRLAVLDSAGNKGTRRFVRRSGIHLTQVVAGGAFSCALEGTGQAWCWGDNRFGQLGRGDTETGWTPGRVVQPAPFDTVVAGEDHACALATGAAWCWGNNEVGQLGDGTTTARSTPVAVVGEHTFVALAPGLDHTCGLDGTGTVWCWGGNALGQLGDGGTEPSAVPVAVDTYLAFASIGAGAASSCGITAEGELHCWGAYGAAEPEPYPLPVRTDRVFRQADLSLRSYGLLLALTVEGELLTLSEVSRAWAPALPALESVEAGAAHACGVVESDKRILCWQITSVPDARLGWRPEADPSSAAPPLPMPLLETGSGGDHGCAITEAGALYCWGDNSTGQHGTGEVQS